MHLKETLIGDIQNGTWKGSHVKEYNKHGGINHDTLKGRHPTWDIKRRHSHDTLNGDMNMLY